ncbi:flagellar hook-basal body complex protein FliE [Tumebacillus sp. ITR2]|uniref:Flagellar hook-basal body complex protein FliE n=1 Tax=Tumebacillus amylolyticus TaxID=2801339 RepID=A0ABS1JF35_9BACL|nr:flagellar hook-basal body complex protein FliE [Tumebacillus amylolyticus]MBL0388907.1 flagellar hook-basal body complex protein FliE [Tumebacillus amylolyticus]
MINSVTNMLPLQGTGSVQTLQPADVKKTTGPSFSDFLSQAIEGINTEQLQADNMTALMAAGKAPDLHSVMIATEKATLSFQMGVQIRNKALESYQEIMRMQM